MDKYLFMDLDDTTFQTVRKCRDNDNLCPAAFSRDGSPLSFMTAGQKELFTFLDSGMTIIPTTARNLSSFNRVNLQFNHCVILNFGGVILTPQREPDPEWLKRMRVHSERVSMRLKDIFSDLQDFVRKEGLTTSVRIISDFGMDYYIVAKNADMRLENIDYIHNTFFINYKLDDCYVHHNDNNLCIIPKYLNKRCAVEYVIDKYISTDSKSFITMGMGDSNSDLSFMSVCDYMIVPCCSQIVKTRRFQ